MSFFTPRFPRSDSWQKTFANMGSILGKKKIATAETFTWKEWPIILDWEIKAGITVDLLNVWSARYALINKMLFLSVGLTFEVIGAGPRGCGNLYVALPENSIPSFGTAFFGTDWNTGVQIIIEAREAGSTAAGDARNLLLYESTSGGLPAGTWDIIFQGFVGVQ